MDKSRTKIAFLTTYPPRECGIATFSKSLVRTFESLYIKDQVKIIAISEERDKYSYSPRVIFEIDQFDQASYAKAAEFINSSSIEVVSLQHEYGIFGGADGKYILKFLENVNKPVITSFHSILRQHGENRLKLTQRIIDLSDTIIVMTNNAKKILLETFKVNPNKIVIIPHGVPNVRYDEKEKVKKKLGFSKKVVLSTFGLINRGKGIEHAIKAISHLARKFPNIIYLIIGATHPNILKHEGEKYRNSLIKLVKKHNLLENVKFINKYLDYEELVNYLQATDIYLAPQNDFNQAFSGTISYALGCANVIISSPTNYALEILSGGRGIIVNPDGELIAREIEKVLENPKLMEKIKLKAYKQGRTMIWPRSGLEYLKTIESNLYIKKEKWKKRLPNFSEAPSLEYIKKTTDSFGIIQHCNLSKPNYEFGYSLDDQARGLIVSAKYLSKFPKNDIDNLLRTYLNYLEAAIDEDGIIHNFIDKNKNYADNIASEDSIARSFWALSYLFTSKNINKEILYQASKLINLYQARIYNSFIHPMAYNLLGFVLQNNKKAVNRIAKIMLIRYEENLEVNKWKWFEERLTWGNGIVPYALLKAYELTKDSKYLKIAQESLSFLENTCRYKGIPAPIGQDGWYYKNSKKALFDQQPIEAADMVLAYNELYNITMNNKHKEKATEWMGWFFGNNINEMIMYDNVTRGIFDGLTRKGVNLNQGAESSLVYLIAYLSFDKGL